MQRHYLIGDLYHNDARLPLKKFAIESDNTFVIRRIGDFNVVSIIEGSWETAKHAEKSTKEGNSKLLTYLAICDIILQNGPRILAISKPTEAGETYELDRLLDIGKSLRAAHQAKERVSPILAALLKRSGQVAEENRHFREFLNKTRSLYLMYYPIVTKSEPLLIATDYLLKVTGSRKLDRHLFIDAMICLEALLSDGGDGVSFKIRMRAGALLMLGGYNGVEVFKKLKELYDKRNEIVHGNSNAGLYGGEAWDIMTIHHELEELVRRCLMYFYILAMKRIKEKNIRKAIVNDLDSSMLDKGLRSSMEREIANGSKKFAFLPFTKNTKMFSAFDGSLSNL